MSYKILQNIEIDVLDPKSIDRAINEIKRIKKALQESMEQLVRDLAMTEGVTIARTQIAAMDAAETGELMNSVYGEYRDGIGYVCAMANNGLGQNYAVYVEFGTGPVGYSNQHAMVKNIGWEYDVGEHIYNDPERGRGWWFYSRHDHQWKFTHGQPARPFMYNTLEILREVASERGKQILFQM